MSQEPNNEFENGPTGEAAPDSIQTPHTPDVSDSSDSDVNDWAEASTVQTETTDSDATYTDAGETGFGAYKPETGEESHAGVGGDMPPPPAYGPRRLVRDPYSRLGGVASGVAHYYGVDVVLVRLLFVAFVLFTGFGVLLYFLAWLIIPRAEYWPPTPPKGGTRAGLDNRQIALGLVAFGVLVAAFAAGGSGSQVLIALGLIGAGVWMFTQNPEPEAQLSTAGPGGQSPGVDPVSAYGTTTYDLADAGTATGDDEPFVSGYSGGSGGDIPPGTPVGYPSPQPVPRRRRRIWPLIVFPFLFLVIPVLLIGSVIAFAIAGDGNVEFREGSLEITGDGPDGELVITATNVDDLLEPIDQSVGSITLDLRNLTEEDFEGYDTPVEVNINGGLGEVDVILPNDLDARVEADVDLGEISALGRNVEGLSPSLSVGEGDPLVDFDIDVDIGSIEVRRVAG